MRLVVTLFSIFLWGAPSLAGETIRFSGGADLNTFQPATIIPLLKEAFGRNGYEFEAAYYPSKRSTVLSNSGQTDGELHRIYHFHKVTNNRFPNLIRIESLMMTVRLVVYSKKDLDISSLDDLEGLTLAHQGGRRNVESLVKNLGNLALVSETPSDEIAFTMLSRGRVDIVIAEEIQGQTILRNSPHMDGIKNVYTIQETEIYSYMHKKHKALAEKIAIILEEMKRDGTYTEITEKVRSSFLNQLN